MVQKRRRCLGGTGAVCQIALVDLAYVSWRPPSADSTRRCGLSLTHTGNLQKT